MIDLDDIFKYKSPDKEKLLSFGFEYTGEEYVINIPIMRKQFDVKISVTEKGTVKFNVFEADTGEEYVLVHVPSAVGGFVGDVRACCEKLLVNISDKCFNTEILKAEQTKRTVEFIKKTYAAEPEFLWERYPNYAVFRIKESQKWFAAIMTIDKNKLGLPGHGNIEIIDLKDIPENVQQRVDEKLFFKAYHMNKKHWYTVCLDGTVSDEKLRDLIQASYNLVAGNK